MLPKERRSSFLIIIVRFVKEKVTTSTAFLRTRVRLGRAARSARAEERCCEEFSLHKPVAYLPGARDFFKLQKKFLYFLLWEYTAVNRDG